MASNENGNPPNGGGDESENDINFTFSDIPILGKSPDDKREDFSFEKFKEPPKQKKTPKPAFSKDNTDHLTAYTQILKHESNDMPVNEERKKVSLRRNTPPPSEDPLQAPLAEDVLADEQMVVKGKSSAKKKKALVVVLALVVLVALGGGAYVFLFSGGSEPASEASPRPPTPKAPPQKVAEKKPASTKNDGAKGQTASGETEKADGTDTQVAETSEDPAERMEREALGDLKAVLKTGDPKVIKKVFTQILEEYPRNASLQLKAQRLLFDKRLNELAEDIYGDWVKKKAHSHLANYLYAKTLKDQDEALAYYQKCIDKEPSFLPPYMKVTDYYRNKRDWEKVSDVCAKCLRHAADLRETRDLMTLAKFRLGRGEEALIDYEKYLRESNHSPSEIGARLVKFAQYLPDPTQARRHLNALSVDPAYMGRHAYYSIRQKAIYGELSDNDFKGLYPQDAREYHILYLLGNKRNKEVLMMPTPPEDFPDFWKVYLDWLRDGEFWKAQANTIMRKHREDPHDVRRLIASMWLGKTSADKAREQLDKIAPEEVPLLYFMLGELYRKERNRMKAKVMFQKALKYQHSPYRLLTKRYLKKH